MIDRQRVFGLESITAHSSGVVVHRFHRGILVELQVISQAKPAQIATHVCPVVDTAANIFILADAAGHIQGKEKGDQHDALNLDRYGQRYVKKRQVEPYTGKEATHHE